MSINPEYESIATLETGANGSHAAAAEADAQAPVAEVAAPALEAVLAPAVSIEPVAPRERSRPKWVVPVAIENTSPLAPGTP